MSTGILSSHVVEIEDVHVVLGGRAVLSGVDTVVARAQLTVIAGPNGAGKSTLLEVLAGTRPPTSGRVTASAESSSFVPQRVAVAERLPVTLRDVVTVGAWGRLGPWRRMDATARRCVDDALEALGLRALQRRRFAELSGGQRQRALLAQGLARGAHLLLLDEPTTALDAASAARIHAAIRSEVNRGAAVVCVTHDVDLIDTADRVILLDGGRIVQPAPG